MPCSKGVNVGGLLTNNSVYASIQNSSILEPLV